MGYPWPSFGGFLFRKEETPIWETDAGWIKSPSYSRARPLGTTIDVIDALSIGSAERTFECVMTRERFLQLEGLLNTKATFTDWETPLPDSRPAFLAEVVPIREVLAQATPAECGSETTSRIILKRQVRVTLISQ